MVETGIRRNNFQSCPAKGWVLLLLREKAKAEMVCNVALESSPCMCDETQVFPEKQTEESYSYNELKFLLLLRFCFCFSSSLNNLTK